MARTAVIAGVGPGLGESLARKFAREGCRVALFARSADYIADLADDLPAPGEGLAVPTDLAEVEQIRSGFETVREEFGPVDVLVNHASAASWEGLQETSVEQFQHAWAVNGRGAFVCAKEAIGDMLDAGGGTVVFTGATSAVRSRGGAISFTSAKFAARGMAMDLAQEFGDRGVTVGHVVVDGQIDEPGARELAPDRDDETFLDPDDMAETYWHLVESDARTMPFEVHLTNGHGTIEFL